MLVGKDFKPKQDLN